MIGTVETRPDQVVHGRIDDNEPLRLTDLFVERFGDEYPRIPHDHPSRLHHERQLQVLHERCNGIGQFLWQWGLLVVVSDSEATTDIQVCNVYTLCPQRSDA